MACEPKHITLKPTMSVTMFLAKLPIKISSDTSRAKLKRPRRWPTGN